MRSELANVVELTRGDDAALEVFEKTTKLGEEVGELCEAVLAQFGRIRMKETTGTPLEEGVDVILMVTDILSSCYPEMSGEELMDEIGVMLIQKKTKWRKMMEIQE